MSINALTYNNELYLKHYKNYKFIVATDWKIAIDINGHIHEIIIKKDFITDLASIPRLLWRILPPFGNYTNAAVLHDFLYFTAIFDRETCDEIFYLSMKKDGVKRWKSYLMYKAVRYFGESYFNGEKDK